MFKVSPLAVLYDLQDKNSIAILNSGERNIKRSTKFSDTRKLMKFKFEYK